MALASPIREKCLTCTRTASKRHLLGGLCPVCQVTRAEMFATRFLDDVKDYKNCFDCSNPLGKEGGWLHWDVNADTFYVLCMPCGEKAFARAGQYRGTEFGYAHKAY